MISVVQEPEHSSFTFHSVQVSGNAICQNSVPSQASSPKKSIFSSSVQLVMPWRLPSGKLSQVVRTWDLCHWRNLLDPVTRGLYSGVQCCHKAWILVLKVQHVLSKLHTGRTGVLIHLCSCNCWSGRNKASGRATQVVWPLQTSFVTLNDIQVKPSYKWCQCRG